MRGKIKFLKDNEDLRANEVVDPVYEIFVARSLLSISQKQHEIVETLIKRLVSIAIECRDQLGQDQNSCILVVIF